MNRVSVLAGIALVLAVTAIAQEGKRGMSRADKVAEQIAAMEREIAAATLQGDASVFGRMAADDFVGINHLGQELNKAQIIARLKTPDIELQALSHEDIRVRVFGDCAIATARTVMKARHKGQEVSGEFPYLRVWLKRNGRWQAVATQSTSIPPRRPE